MVVLLSLHQMFLSLLLLCLLCPGRYYRLEGCFLQHLLLWLPHVLQLPQPLLWLEEAAAEMSAQAQPAAAAGCCCCWQGAEAGWWPVNMQPARGRRSGAAA
jgi:hypothetical protein